MHTGVKNDTVGPGEYDIPRTIGAQKKGVVQWQAPRQARKPGLSSLVSNTIAPGNVSSQTPGPGSY